MITCKYCGQELVFLGEKEKEHYFNCSFCDMVFPLKETCTDRKRKMSVPSHLETYSFYESTEDLLRCDTITLYHVLKELRSFWYMNKKTLEKLKVHCENNELPDPKKEESDELTQMQKEYKKEFIHLTKKKFVIENIILERTGFLPSKITNQFLNEMVEQGEQASGKAMYVYIK